MNLLAKNLQHPFQVQNFSLHPGIGLSQLLDNAGGLFEIFWFKQGVGTFVVDFETRRIAQNTICCTKPGQVRKLEAQVPLIGYRLAFSEEFLGNDARRTLEPLNRFDSSLDLVVSNLDFHIGSELEETFQAILAECSNRHAFKKELLQGFVSLLFSYFPGPEKTFAKEGSVTRDVLLFHKFMSKLECDFRTKKQVCEYASDLHVGAGYLSQVVRQISGFSVSNCIRKRVLLEAKRMAVISNAAVCDVAYELGFNDPATFSKFFKNFSGYNFTDFRCKQASS